MKIIPSEAYNKCMENWIKAGINRFEGDYKDLY